LAAVRKGMNSKVGIIRSRGAKLKQGWGKGEERDHWFQTVQRRIPTVQYSGSPLHILRFLEIKSFYRGPSHWIRGWGLSMGSIPGETYW
jgi:hypothetical protein